MGAMPNWPWRRGARTPYEAALDVPATATWKPWPVVARDIPIGVDYWSDGFHEIVPPVAARRFERLNSLRALYEGDTASLGLADREASVYVNYFSRFSNMVYFLLLAYPPDYAGLDEDVLSAGAINEVLGDIVIDLSRYGTALFWAGSGVIERADPRYWFPEIHGRGAYVSLAPAVSTDGQFVDGGYATVTRRLSPETYDVLAYKSPDGMRLGDLLISGPTSAIGEPLWPVTLSPTEGGFGPSPYEAMVPIVAELTRRQSRTSGILNRHSNPLMVAHPKTGRQPPNMPAPADSEAVRERLREVVFESGATNDERTYVPPPWVERMEYLVWDASLAAAFQQFDAMLDALAAVTGVPESLYGILRGGGQPSGASLRRQHVAAYLLLETYEHAIIPVLTNVIRAAGGGEVEITWLNPLDQLDAESAAQRIMAGEDEELEADIRTGRNLGEDDAAPDDDEPPEEEE